MNAKSRIKLEMGRRALAFSQAHPDPSAGYAAALSTLEELLKRAQELEDRQLKGIKASRTAADTKRTLRKRMRGTQMVHLSRAAKVAAKVLPELSQKFSLPRRRLPDQSFLTAARAMVAEAQTHKDVLVRHGMAETVVTGLSQALDQFVQAVQQGIEARRAHVGASAELKEVADDVVDTVKVMDAFNRDRFTGNTEVLAEWESASNVFGPPRPPAEKPEEVPPPSGGESKTAG